jgi:hypothetical protein
MAITTPGLDPDNIPVLDDIIEEAADTAAKDQAPTNPAQELSLQPLVDDIVLQLMPGLEQQLKVLVKQALKEQLPDNIKKYIKKHIKKSLSTDK